jgi:hypothetical protein
MSDTFVDQVRSLTEGEARATVTFRKKPMRLWLSPEATDVLEVLRDAHARGAAVTVEWNDETQEVVSARGA